MRPGLTTAAGDRPSLFRSASVAQSLGVYLPATVASRLIGLVRGVVLAWLMSPQSEFGLLQVALLVVNVLNPLCGAGLNEAVARYVPQYEARRCLRPYLARAVPFVLVVALGLSAAACLAATPLGRFLFATFEPQGSPGVAGHRIGVLTRLAVATAFAMVGYFLLLAVLKGLRMFHAVSLVELANNAGFTLTAIGLALAGWNTAGAILAGYSVVLAATILLFMPPLRRVLRGAVEQGGPLDLSGAAGPLACVVGQMLRFSLWAALAAIMWQTLLSYPTWYLQKVHGLKVTADFSGVRLLTQIVLIGAVAIVTVVQTSVTRTWEAHGRAEADRRLLLAHKSTALGLIVGCAALTALANLLIRVFPAEYRQGAVIIPLSLTFYLLCGHLAFLSIHFNLIERTRYLFLPWVLGVACTVGVARWLVQPGQDSVPAMIAAARSGVLGATAALAVCLVLMRIERRPMDRGVLLLIVLSYALTLRASVLALTAGGVLLLALGTNLLFAPQERQRLWEYAAAGRRRLLRLFSPGTA